MASLVATPSPGIVGQPIYVVGEGFTASAEVTLTVAEPGLGTEIVASGGGAISNSGLADHATVTLTGAGQPSAGETFTLGTQVYTMRATVATFAGAYEVLIGAALTNTLDNIKAAVNGVEASLGSLFSANTLPHPTVFAGAKTATTVVFYARTPGTGGNSIASTETLTNNSFGAGTLTGGAAALARPAVWLPTEEGTYNLRATDGTNTATLQVRVYTS